MITDRKLFKAIETALASGNTVYLINPNHQPTEDGSELIRNSALIRGKRGTFPADFLRSANSDQFLRALKHYARFECEACGQSCQNEYYMLRRELWRKVCRSKDMLCIGCVEHRLGRKLVRADFNLEETFARATQFPSSRRLKQRLGVGWCKSERLNRALAVSRSMLALWAKAFGCSAIISSRRRSVRLRPRNQQRPIGLTCGTNAPSSLRASPSRVRALYPRAFN
jgi:hypothetical protein